VIAAAGATNARRVAAGRETTAELGRTMPLDTSELLDGELPILGKAANAIITPSELAISRFPFDQYLWIAGMKDREGIGGKLHLTSYRLLFKSHALNRVTGRFSIFLPSITRVSDASRLWTRKLAIDTAFARHEFVVWGVPALIGEIERARAQLPDEALGRVAAAALAAPERCGDGLQAYHAVELAVRAFHGQEALRQAWSLATNPLQAMGALAFQELLERATDRWNDQFNR